MTTTRNSNHSKETHTSGKQGFASMPKEEVRDIASKGGQSHGGSSQKSSDDRRKAASTEKSHVSRDDKYEEKREHGKQGFASMPHDQVVEIARKGGQHSHDNTNSKK